jgi:hypothetical protein
LPVVADQSADDLAILISSKFVNVEKMMYITSLLSALPFTRDSARLLPAFHTSGL